MAIVFVTQVVAAYVTIVIQKRMITCSNERVVFHMIRRRCLEFRELAINKQRSEPRIDLNDDVVLQFRRIAMSTH